MTEPGHTRPLTRRVPGASGSGPRTPARTPLPAALLAKMRAATDAARGADAIEAEEVGEVADPGASADPSASGDPDASGGPNASDDPGTGAPANP